MNGMKRWGSNEFKSNLMFAKRCTSSAPTLSRVSLPDWRLKWEMTFEWDWMPLNVRSICPWCVFANRVVGGIESEVCLQSSNALNLFNRLCMYVSWILIVFLCLASLFLSLSLFRLLNCYQLFVHFIFNAENSMLLMIYQHSTYTIHSYYVMFSMLPFRNLADTYRQ